MRFAEILARLEQQRFHARWRRMAERGMAPPPESDLSRPISPAFIIGLYQWKVDGAGDLGLYYSGTEVADFTDTGQLDIAPGLTGGAGAQTYLTAAGVKILTWGNNDFGPSFMSGVAGFRIPATTFFDNPIHIEVGGIAEYNGINTAGGGVPAQRGLDARKNIGVTDTNPIVVYAVPAGAANLAYRLTARVFGFSGTVSAASYVITWVEGGVTITKTLSITAVDTDADLSIGIQPDLSTNVTAQITALTGTLPTVNVLCLVEGISSGT